MDLLTEPRAHVPYDHVRRLLHVSEHTVKAIEKAQTTPIAERKERLLAKALRIASKAADRIEDQIDSANITQATIAFGVATEKSLLLAGEPFQRIQLNVMTQPQDIYSEVRAIQAQIVEALRPLPSLAPIDAELLLPAPDAAHRATRDRSGGISASD